jgi:hypothetical protein
MSTHELLASARNSERPIDDDSDDNMRSTTDCDRDELSVDTGRFNKLMTVSRLFFGFGRLKAVGVELV